MKNYKKPTMQIIKVDLISMIAQSPESGSVNFSPEEETFANDVKNMNFLGDDME